MKKIIFVIFFILVFPLTCGFLNIAHRGDNEQGKLAEHSRMVYDRAFCVQIDYLELDLQRVSDNVLVVSHNDNLSRVFSVDKIIADYPYRELLSYKNQNGESLHSLGDVFKRYQNSSVKFITESKDNSEEDIKLLLNLTGQYHLENRTSLESFSKTALMQISKINPQIPTMQLAGEFNLLPSTQHHANNSYSEKMADYLSEHDKKYLLWGVNKKVQVKQYLQLDKNVSGLLTDYPAELANTLHSSDISKRNYEASSLPSKSISDLMYLKDGSPVEVGQIGMKDNQLFCHIRSDLWLSDHNLKNSNHSAPKAQTGKIKLQKETLIYTDPSLKKYSGRKLPQNSTWNYFVVKKVRGKTVYNLGGAQWVKQ